MQAMYNKRNIDVTSRNHNICT